MPMNTARKGCVSEHKAMVWLIEQGYEVYENISAEGPFDLIAIRPGETIYVDVKTVTERMDYGIRSLGSAGMRPSAKKYPDLNKKLLYVYNNQVAWRLLDLVMEPKTHA